ncbi:pelle-like serine/threonine-protein kinase pik-1 [Nasonia vitripennis]|uniref:non-specific serine/threonine protein kinase n=1 Tax=Nasonia vitripennis TaxID=7425 RepID=A0A7M7LVG3_NASVI|nr:pelle-like serine/threonine-protein kinase pik-1 [Nasonia vitripennis]XP_008217913.1 pelle-like serine/threonine-protein kinase pik-1 [Nasonia vitripennis]XP_016842206.1 pelle-like serine/threonine-protein kinase pik-1 [Nasonia vitripennis]XP_032457537.1 pelle-like serine/threonine-protein kinase pik-1 [Nasonia vitripennis]XP_032457538.1 pelle-like serine/threonine-protein kinase pik-1 [Nasonia vitripennis]XP_032457539.1 pelle-like serine/threonine-protein kinase pik-1 [Nasonia vitripennis]
MASSTKSIKFIYQLPYLERVELCKILNQNNKWEELAGVWMGFNNLEIQNLRKEQNPTEELLAIWEKHNHTVLELFMLLARMHHYQAMLPIKSFVDSKYHTLLYNGEGNLQKLLRNGELRKDTKDLKIGAQNFNQKQKCQENAAKILVNNSLKDESSKILNQPMPHDQQNETPSNSNNLLASLPAIFSTLLPRIPYSELAAATDNWKREHLLGKGGFGTVFKGIWKNTEVAIKKIEPRGSDYDESYALQLEQSFREIKILNSLPHENILPLYAYSIGGEAPCLVYQCMKNGSLEDRLHLKHGSYPLNWIQRREIAKGIARGLQYLHTIHEKPLIHGDIKSANILLDKNFEPKIGDFGLAREGSSDDSLKVSKIQGTRPYLPEEYIFKGNLSTKIDTYSYGIVLFELATGLSAYDKSRPTNKKLKEYVDSFEDKDLHLLRDKKAGDKYIEVYKYLLLLGKWCSNKLAEHRPQMSTVYDKFKN